MPFLSKVPLDEEIDERDKSRVGSLCAQAASLDTDGGIPDLCRKTDADGPFWTLFQIKPIGQSVGVESVLSAKNCPVRKSFTAEKQVLVHTAFSIQAERSDQERQKLAEELWARMLDEQGGGEKTDADPS